MVAVTHLTCLQEVLCLNVTGVWLSLDFHGLAHANAQVINFES